MKMKTNIYKKVSALTVMMAALLFTSCVDTVILPENKTLDEDFWQKKSQVESVVAMAYSQLRNQDLLKELIVWGDFRSDELVISNNFQAVNPTVTALTEINNAKMTSANMFTKWAPLYSCINYCNLVLEKARNVVDYDPNYTENDYLTSVSQVKALKAWCYFTLVRVFRDVPVTPGAYMNSSAEVNEPQKAPAEVLQMCIDDLESVRGYAPKSTAYRDSRDRGYFNIDGINALLADIYLWRASVMHNEADYQKVLTYCDEVFAAKKAAHSSYTFHAFEEQDFYLADYLNFYDDIFGENGQNAEESIMEVQYKVNNQASNSLFQMYYGFSSYRSGYGFVKASRLYGIANGITTSDNIFKGTYDLRYWNSIYDVGSSIDQFPVRKFVGLHQVGDKESFNTDRNTYLQNWILYRLSDVMLMKAEALLMLNQPEDAFELIKEVNKRAYSDQQYVIGYNAYRDRMETLLYQERARELCFEGKRWFDLMRMYYRDVEGTQYDKTMSQILQEGGSFPTIPSSFAKLAFSKYSNASMMISRMPDERYLYMPINKDEVEINTNLVQNSAYKN